MNPALVALALVASCAHVAAAPPAHHAVIPVRATSSPPPVTPPAPSRDHGPRRDGCDTHPPTLPGFHEDPHALDAIDPPGAPDAAPTRELADGYVRLAVPADWFPARADGTGFRAYQLRADGGDADEVFGVYLGDAPAFRPHTGDEFRLALGAAVARGVVFSDGGFDRLEALVLLPCSTPRYAYFWARTRSRPRLAQMARVLRSLRLDATAHNSSSEVTVDPARDAAAVAAITAADPLAHQLVAHALAAGAVLHAIYPLATVHPLADQVLYGRYTTTLEGHAVDVLVRLPVHAGVAHAPRVFAALADGALARELPALGRAGCGHAALTIAHDGLAVRCAGEPEVRVAVDDEADAAALPRALARFVHARATLSRWDHDPALAGGWPASLCPRGEQVRVVPDGGALYVTAGERCAVLLDGAREALLASAMRGECADVPVAPWSATLRSVGRFDDVRGEHGTYCRFALGWSPRGSYVIAAGDASTASAPITHGPTLAVDRRGVNTAVAFLHDLVAYALGQSDQAPANAPPSLLHTLGADAPGSPAADATLRLLAARGGLSDAAMSQRGGELDGPGLASVLAVRAIDAEHMEVTLLPVVVALTSHGPDGAWVVTRVTAAAPR